MAARRQQGADDQFQKREPRRLWAGLHDLADPSAKGRREAGVVMRFHGVCGRLVAHPLHGDLPPGDTLVRNPHRSSKSTGLETPVMVIQSCNWIARKGGVAEQIQECAEARRWALPISDKPISDLLCLPIKTDFAVEASQHIVDDFYGRPRSAIATGLELLD